MIIDQNANILKQQILAHLDYQLALAKRQMNQPYSEALAWNALDNLRVNLIAQYGDEFIDSEYHKLINYLMTHSHFEIKQKSRWSHVSTPSYYTRMNKLIRQFYQQRGVVM